MDIVKGEYKEVNRAQCSMLNEAIEQLIMGIPTMSGSMLIYFKSIQKKLDLIGKESQDKHKAILDKHIKMKGGDYVLTEPSEEELAQGVQPEYVYKSDDHKQKAEAQMRKLYDGTVKTIFKKMPSEEFGKLQITPARNPRIGLIMEYLLHEVPEDALEIVE